MAKGRRKSQALPKEVRKLLLDADKHVIVPKQSGWMIRFDNGDQVMIHGTPSDHRALRNTRARLQQNRSFK